MLYASDFRKKNNITHLLKNNKERATRISVTPGGRLNKKDGLTKCGDSHVKDKTS